MRGANRPCGPAHRIYLLPPCFVGTPKTDTFFPVSALQIHAVSCRALVARPSRRAELRRARRAAFSKPQLVWLDGRAERMRAARIPAAGWVQLMSRSPVEMWSDSTACLLYTSDAADE